MNITRTMSRRHSSQWASPLLSSPSTHRVALAKDGVLRTNWLRRRAREPDPYPLLSDPPRPPPVEYSKYAPLCARQRQHGAFRAPNRPRPSTPLPDVVLVLRKKLLSRFRLSEAKNFLQQLDLAAAS